MKVLFLIHQYFPDSIGGTEVLLYGLAKSLQTTGHEVAIFAYRESAESNPAAFGTRHEVLDGIGIYRFYFNLSKHPNVPQGEYHNQFCDQALRAVLEEFSPDVAHVFHGMKLGGGIFEVLAGADVPVVTTLSDYWYFCLRHSLLLPDHSPCLSGPEPADQCIPCLMHQLSLPDTDRVAAEKAIEERNPYLQQAVLRSKVLIALSEHQRDTYIRFGFPAERLEVLRHGVNVELFASAREHHRRHPEIEKERPTRLLYVGNLLPHKGVHLLIEALLGFTEGNLELRIVGNADHGGAYAEALLTKSKQDGRIAFVGECAHDQLSTHYEWCDVLLMPSIWDENEPLVIKEARWCGIPVATHALLGLGELVKHDQDGWLVNEKSADSWEDCFSYLETAQSRYFPPTIEIPTIESFAKMMLSYYQDAV